MWFSDMLCNRQCDIYSLKCCTFDLYPIAKSQLSKFVQHKCFDVFFFNENDYHSKIWCTPPSTKYLNTTDIPTRPSFNITTTNLRWRKNNANSVHMIKFIFFFFIFHSDTPYTPPLPMTDMLAQWHSTKRKKHVDQTSLLSKSYCSFSAPAVNFCILQSPQPAETWHKRSEHTVYAGSAGLIQLVLAQHSTFLELINWGTKLNVSFYFLFLIIPFHLFIFLSNWISELVHSGFTFH